MCDISGWMKDHLSDSDELSGPKSSIISDDEAESGLFSLSEHLTTDEICESPSFDDREKEIQRDFMNYHLSDEEMKMHAHQIEKAKGLYRVSLMIHNL